MVHLVSPRLNLGCHFDNQLYLILGASQDDVDDGVDVGDVDFAITIHVSQKGATISAQNNVDDGIHISNIDFTVAIHVTLEYIFHNLPEIGIPVLISPVGISRPLHHMKRTTRAIRITRIELLISARYSREVSNVAIHIRQPIANIERTIADGGNGVWNGDVGQCAAELECRGTD